jgi:hypothetical protein
MGKLVPMSSVEGLGGVLSAQRNDVMPRRNGNHLSAVAQESDRGSRDPSPSPDSPQLLACRGIESKEG